MRLTKTQGGDVAYAISIRVPLTARAAITALTNRRLAGEFGSFKGLSKANGLKIIRKSIFYYGILGEDYYLDDYRSDEREEYYEEAVLWVRKHLKELYLHQNSRPYCS